MEKKVLGRGLDALIPKKNTVMSTQEFVYLPLAKIKPARRQPRQEVEGSELGELTQSIKEKGVIQPIVARKIEGGSYEIVAGERRYRAAKSLRLKEIPTIIKTIDSREAFVLAIIENLQRTDLNPLEEAGAFQRLIEEFGFSLENVAQFTGKNKTTIVNALRLLKLPEKIKSALRQGRITRTQARVIVGVENPKEQEDLFRQILNGKLSLRDIEKKARLVSRKKRKEDAFALEVEEGLQKILGTKVKVFSRRNNRGKVVIEYYGLTDLERIIKIIKK